MTRVTVRISKWIKTADGYGHRSVDFCLRSGDVVLKINEEKLAQLLGPRALRGKSRRSILAGGAIVATVVNVSEELFSNG